MRPGGAEDGTRPLFRAPGLVFSVHSTCTQFWDEAAPALSGLQDLTQGNPDITYEVVDRGRAYAPSRWLVYRDGSIVLDAPSAGVALVALLSDVDHAVVAAVSGHCLAMHAGAVELDGRVAVLPASSGSGKSTLTAAAVAAGGRYVTDEMTVIDPATLSVSPYLRPLCIKPGSHRIVRRLVAKRNAPQDRSAIWHVAPDWLGQCSTGGTVAAIVVPSYARGADTQLLPLTKAEAIMAVGAQTSLPSRRGSELLPILKSLAVASVCHRLVFSDPRRAADRLLEVLA